MDKSKTQILVLHKSELETVAKALSTGCWTFTDSEETEIIDTSTTSDIGCSSKLTIAQGNVQPITHVSKAGGCVNVKRGVLLEPLVLQKSDYATSPVTLAGLGKKLSQAAKVGDASQVRRLLYVGAPFASDGPIGMNPLHLAAQNGHYEICDRLLSAGINKNARNKVDKTAIHLAVMAGHTEIVRLLLKNGVDVNVCDMLRMTPLHWACVRGHTSIVRLLLQHKMQTDVTNKFHKTPLQLAKENRHDVLVRLLEGKIPLDEEEEEEEEEVEVEEPSQKYEESESIRVNASVFNPPSTSLGEIPSVCKTEEVFTEEVLEEEVCESPEHPGDQEETVPEASSDLPHSIIDDLKDQNMSMLAATLAELTQATKSPSDHSLEMSNAAALELLKAQAALLPLDDCSTLVTSAVAHGQTLHLTEAGKQALKLIKPDLPLFPTNTLPKEKCQEEEKSSDEKRSKIPNRQQKDHISSPSIIALPAPPSPLLIQSQFPSTSKSSLSSPSSLLPVSSLSSLPSTSSPSSPFVHPVSCLPALLPPSQSVEVTMEEEMDQVITLTPEQFAALTNNASGPVILQVLPSGDTIQEIISEASPNPFPSTSKRQKII